MNSQTVLKSVKVTVAKACKKSLLIRQIVKKARFLLYRSQFLHIYRNNALDEHLILFEAFKGNNYCDSPRAIYEELLRQDTGRHFTFVWAFMESKLPHHLPDDQRTKQVLIHSSEYFTYLTRAKYIVTNSRIPVHIKKRSGQKIIQTWHGTPLKRLGCDIQVDYDNPYNSVKEVHRQYETDAGLFDYLLSPSAYATEKLSSTFNLNKLGKTHVVIEEGYPRNDFLYTHKASDAEDIKTRLGLPKDKKVILYAPTFRDNKHEAGVGYTFLPPIDFDQFQEVLGGEYILLFRAHYFVAKSFDFSKYEGFIFDVSAEDDINDLYVVSDLLITDYSSVFFDFAALGRPILFFMYDLESYRNQLRGFYLELDELPGPVVEKQEELLQKIQSIQTVKHEYQEIYRDFQNKFNSKDDGHASERVVRRIGFLEQPAD